MKRREFLKAGALVVVGTAAAASGVVGIANADDAAAAQLSTLNQAQGATLLKITRRIFPHKQIDDGPYWSVVRDLDAAAASDSTVAKLVADGLAALDTGWKHFVDMSDQEQTEALKKIETTPFFQKVRSVELQSFYSNPDVWKVLGYQGPAYRFGGYIKHGFDDLAWLPNPPESASPKPS